MDVIWLASEYLVAMHFERAGEPAQIARPDDGGEKLLVSTNDLRGLSYSHLLLPSA